MLFPASFFFSYRQLNEIPSSPTFDYSILADDAKFVTTIFSGALNLSRSGSKRVNLNKVVSDSTDPTEIRKQLDQIVASVQYHTPNFGQRFFRNTTALNSYDVINTSASPLRTIYLNKIAANIRDYIDTDSQPTVINPDGDPNALPTPKPFTVRLGAAPTHSFVALGGGTTGPNEVIAIGKERIPLIQEYALRVRQNTFSAKTGTSAAYNITIDHYVEVWNNTNTDIPIASLGPNPFLLIANQPGWDAGGLDDIPAGPSRDLRLPLNTAKSLPGDVPLTTFSAGTVTVLTTDTETLATLTPTTAKVYNLPIPTPSPSPSPPLRIYSGSTQKKNTNNYLRLNMIDRTTISSDYETEIAIANDLGMLESAWGAGAISTALSVNVDDGPAPTGSPSAKFNTSNYHFRGASLKGNVVTAPSPTPAATTGDPRTNAEQLRFDLNGASTGNDKTRYYSSGLNDNLIPSNSTLGGANSNYVVPSKWPDYSSSNQSSVDAPAVIANSAITSIGQLGDIFDPIRAAGDATGNDSDGIALKIKLSRSGGRTLRIGQSNRFDSALNPLGVWDGDSNSPSREWTAWRLTDVFSTTDAVQLDGRININGVSRDSGAALRAALYGYVFQDPQLGSPPLNDGAINLLIDQMRARAANDGSASYNGNTYPQFATTSGPFVERGEISEMPLFNTGTDLTGTLMTTVYDRGREELFRRLTELTTTRGNVFSVYAVGQSLIPPPVGSTAEPTVTATSEIKITFRVDPVWDTGTPSDPFVPTNLPADPRFRKPDRYAIKILYAGE